MSLHRWFVKFHHAYSYYWITNIRPVRPYTFYRDSSKFRHSPRGWSGIPKLCPGHHRVTVCSLGQCTWPIWLCSLLFRTGWNTCRTLRMFIQVFSTCLVNLLKSLSLSAFKLSILMSFIFDSVVFLLTLARTYQGFRKNGERFSVLRLIGRDGLSPSMKLRTN